MNFEAFTQSKYRTTSEPGDDCVLLVPGVMAAVLDGATDPLGKQKNGVSPGKFAAETIAQACTRLFMDRQNTKLSADEIVRHLSDELAIRIKQMGFVGSPSTTLSLILFLPDSIRLIGVGDSGIRINGDRVYRHAKLIDDVSATSRIAVFSILKQRLEDRDVLEQLARQAAFLGFDNLRNSDLKNGILTKDDIAEVISLVQSKFMEYGMANDIKDFLVSGIKTQNRFANLADHPLGYSSLNGQEPSMADVIDERIELSQIQTIEVFSDGYLGLPQNTSVADWEAMHRDIEREDFHKTDDFPSVKGSMSTEFFDDRSIVSIQL